MPELRDPVTERVYLAADGLTRLLAEAAAARAARAEVAAGTPEKPTPERPTPERPTPERPTPERPTPAADPTVGEAARAGSAVCAWNHFENIPTFYNWNNRPR